MSDAWIYLFNRLLVLRQQQLDFQEDFKRNALLHRKPGTKENAVSIAILPSKWLFRGAQSSQTWSDTNA
jgi:hypothetical protein